MLLSAACGFTGCEESSTIQLQTLIEYLLCTSCWAVSIVINEVLALKELPIIKRDGVLKANNCAAG